jgi:phosphoserine phosphatase
VTGGGVPGAPEATGPGDASLIPDGLDATVVLLRHGESEWIREGRFQGQSETPLSDLGRRQAWLAGERLARPHASPALPVPGGVPREIVHSPLGRTTETARAVAGAIGRELSTAGAASPAAPVSAPPALRPDPGFLELAQGAWEGVTADEIGRRWPAEIGAWRRDPVAAWAPGGESIIEVRARVRPALGRLLDELGRDYPRGTVDRPQVGGYHGVGQAPDQPWSIVVGHDGVFKIVLLALFGLPLSHFWSFSMSLTGITVVELRGGRPVLRAHNWTGHLAPIEDEQAREAAELRSRSGAL